MNNGYIKKLRKILRILLISFAAYAAATLIVALSVNEALMSKDCLPDSFGARPHDDYTIGRWKLPLISRIPWNLTAWCFVEPPIYIAGNQKSFYEHNGHRGLKPIPAPGEWQLSLVRVREGLPFFLPYFAFTMHSGNHFRAGCRLDDVDFYYVFPSISLKRLHDSSPESSDTFAAGAEGTKR
jgi:hypothetical protein